MTISKQHGCRAATTDAFPARLWHPPRVFADVQKLVPISATCIAMVVMEGSHGLHAEKSLQTASPYSSASLSSPKSYKWGRMHVPQQDPQSHKFGSVHIWSYLSAACLNVGILVQELDEFPQKLRHWGRRVFSVLKYTLSQRDILRCFNHPKPKPKKKLETTQRSTFYFECACSSFLQRSLNFGSMTKTC